MNKLSGRLEALDSLRGLASMGIVLFHIQGIHHLALPGWCMFLVSQLGMGVPFFFMLSSFSILYSLRNTTLSQPEIKKYLLRRFFRLAPLYYLMIVIYIGYFYFNNYKTNISIQEVFLNLTFSFSFSTINYQGIVWAGWSIGIEFLMYFLLPVFMSIASGVKSALTLFLLCLALGAIFSHQFTTVSYINNSYNYMHLAVMLPFFAMGILCFRLFERNILANINKYVLMVLSIVLLVCILYPLYSTVLQANSLFKYLGGYRVFFYGWAIFLFCILILQLYKPIALLHNRVLVFLGKISYSLYLIHPLLVLCLQGKYNAVYRHVQNQTLAFCCCIVLTCCILIPLAYLAYRLIENPGINLGKNFIKRLDKTAIDKKVTDLAATNTNIVNL